MNKLKEARSILGLTQAQLAEILGASVSTIKEIEAGRQKNLPIEFVEKLADKFGFSYRWLLVGKGEKYDLTEKLLKEKYNLSDREFDILIELITYLNKVKKDNC
jgi:transcriptional regulator with XRE-family HTH domain